MKHEIIKSRDNIIRDFREYVDSQDASRSATILDIEKKTGIHHQSLHRWYRGDADITVSNLDRLNEAMIVMRRDQERRKRKGCE